MTTARIFDDFHRTDPAPAYDTESSYHFLNRVARPQWELVRNPVDEWFSDYRAMIRTCGCDAMSRM